NLPPTAVHNICEHLLLNAGWVLREPTIATNGHYPLPGTLAIRPDFKNQTLNVLPSELLQPHNAPAVMRWLATHPSLFPKYGKYRLSCHVEGFVNYQTVIGDESADAPAELLRLWYRMTEDSGRLPEMAASLGLESTVDSLLEEELPYQGPV